MLATTGRPFDSDDFLFELKWDGIRAAAYVDGDREYRLINRRRVDLTDRYPDFAGLAALPPGCVIDGEIVVFRDGKPSFPSVLTRQSKTKLAIERGVKSMPATFIAFDLLYENYQPIMGKPLRERRERLEAIVRAASQPRLIMSQGVVGDGIHFFEECSSRKLEGMMAKRLDGRYEPGQRSGLWVKVKRELTFACVVIGFTPAEDRPGDFRALVIATPGEDGQLTCVGRVGSGFNEKLRARVNSFLWTHRVDKPVIPCKEKAIWVEPKLYCTVRCMERSATGQLREPVFGELHGDIDKKPDPGDDDRAATPDLGLAEGQDGDDDA